MVTFCRTGLSSTESFSFIAEGNQHRSVDRCGTGEGRLVTGTVSKPGHGEQVASSWIILGKR
jgi:hypothetical protein